MSPCWASTRFLGGHMISWMPTKCCGLPRMLWASTKLVGDHEKSWASTLCIVVIQSCPLTSNMSLHTHPVATTSVHDMRPVSSIYVHVSRPSVSMMPPATPTLVHVSCPHTSSIRPRSPTSHVQLRPRYQPTHAHVSHVDSHDAQRGLPGTSVEGHAFIVGAHVRSLVDIHIPPLLDDHHAFSDLWASMLLDGLPRDSCGQA